MDMSGEYRIPAPRDQAWRGLNDPEILRQCIPGCESLEKVSDSEFTARVALTVGPVKAKFSGKVSLAEVNPPHGYTISGEGQGGVAGFGKGSAKVRLEEDGPDATVLRYTAQATVGGKLAQIGTRLVQATAKKLTDEFFSRFVAVIASPPAEPEPAREPAGGPVETSPVPKRPAIRPLVWVPALIVLIGFLLWVVTGQ